MDEITGAWDWLTTGANWAGTSGVWHRLGEHLYLTLVCLAISCAIALPVALYLGHIGKGGALAVNISNAGRAVPTFAVLVVLMLTPLGKHGDVPTIIALVLFAVPPLLTNAYVGMREADQDVVEAARGMGMSGWQLLGRVELPLAFPLIMTGLRTAAVQVVATTTLAALPGGGGLGRIITAGFNTYNTGQVVAGAVLVAGLALLVEGVLVVAERLLSPLPAAVRAARRRAERERRAEDRVAPATAVKFAAGGTAAIVALAAVVIGYGGRSLEDSSARGGGGKGSVVVGAAGFTEFKIMAELYAQILDDAGFSASIQPLKARELYEPALEKGQIDVAPEYAATLAEFLNAKENGPDAPAKNPVASDDTDKTVAALKKLAEPRGLKVLSAGDAIDQNAFAVTKEFAEKHDLTTLSDLGASKLKIKLAAGDECGQRPFCSPGLKKTYGIDVTDIDPKGVGTVQSKQAVKDGTDDMLLTTTTDATLEDFGLVLLEDDKGLQNADNVLPVVNAKDAGGAKLEAVLDKLTRVLTTQDLADMNRAVDADREKPADVAKDYLEKKGLLSK